MSESDESIHHIEETKNIVKQQKHFTAKINGTPKEFIIDTGSPVTIKSLDEQIMKTTEIQKISLRYQKIEILITERTDITALLGMDRMKKIQTDNRENTTNRN